MADIAIRVENLSKLYRIGTARERHDTLRDALAARLRRSRGAAETNTIWALKDVTFEVQRGEVVGVIGRNGAGKSTLLKILSRITEPTNGRAEIHGRVGSLLEVGTGFHPELTGRENIFLNGAILGMKRSEIAARFDEIVAFAEVEKFLDTPVKRYSSGMYVRLAFAVAAHLEPEILLVDEVLAVGDAEFQRKCLGKMGDVAKAGRTVLFVSHNVAAAQSLCGRGLLLDGGRLKLQGPVSFVLTSYADRMKGRAPGQTGAVIAENYDTGVALLGVETVDPDGRPASARCGEDVRIEMRIRAGRDIRSAVLTIGLNDRFGNRVTVLHSEMVNDTPPLRAGENRVRCAVPRFPLVPGQYWLDILLLAGREWLLSVPNAGPLEVGPGDFYGTGRVPDPDWAGAVYLGQSWQVVADDARDEQ